MKINEDFVAGFWEGDGSASFGYNSSFKRRFCISPRIIFSQKDIVLLKKIDSFFGKGSFCESGKEPYTRWVLRYWKQENLVPILKILSKNYLSNKRKEQLLPLLNHLKIESSYLGRPSIDWIKGFFIAEGTITEPYYLNSRHERCFVRRFDFTQQNEPLLKSIRYVLFDNNIFSNIYSFKNRTNKSKLNFRLVVSRTQSKKLFSDLFLEGCQTKQEFVERLVV